MLARLHLPRGTKYYEDALEGLVRVNADLYRDNPRLPSVLSAGVKYVGYDPREDWRNAIEVVRERKGDCEDLAAARAGELRARGDYGARAIVRRTGPHMTHAMVMRGNGTIEDPSRLLGMGKRRDEIGGIAMADYPGYDDDLGANLLPKKSRFPRVTVRATRATFSPAFASRPVATLADSEPHTINAPADDGREDPFVRPSDVGDEDNDAPFADDFGDWESLGNDPNGTTDVQFVVAKTANGWQGTVKVPMNAGRALVVARQGETKKAAGERAMSAAAKVLESPVAKALIPPQAQVALRVLQSPTAQKAALVAFKAAKHLKFW